MTIEIVAFTDVGSFKSNPGNFRLNYIRVDRRPVTARDSHSLLRLVPMLFASALFVIIATAHILATLKLSVRDESVQIDDRIAKNIRLVETIDEKQNFGIGYGILCIAMIWFSAYRQYPYWAGWLIFIFLAAPWLLYLKACAMVVHNVIAIPPH